MNARVVLLGATGYTGALVLQALLRRGVKPVVAGRNQAVITEVARAAGGLDHSQVDADDCAAIKRLLEPGDVLITTVGPFERYGHSVARAAAEAGAHYIDSTGEVGFVLNLHRQLDARARASGSLMLPAFGYDYIPGLVAGTLAARAAGPAARSLDIGYFASGSLWRGLSQGTRTTMRDGLTLPSLRWSNGCLINERTASTSRTFTVAGRLKRAFLVSGTEVLHLPTAFPTLDNVTVYNGWFPHLSRPATALSTLTHAVARIRGGHAMIDLLTRPVIGPPGGPGETERARTRTRVVAEARSENALLTQVMLEGPSIYILTAELMAWAADQLTTHPPAAAGVLGPVEAFGFDALSRGCDEIGLVSSTLE